MEGYRSRRETKTLRIASSPPGHEWVAGGGMDFRWVGLFYVVSATARQTARVVQYAGASGEAAQQ